MSGTREQQAGAARAHRVGYTVDGVAMIETDVRFADYAEHDTSTVCEELLRRITAIRASLSSRLAIFVGVDDLILEGIDAGAVGWIAGLLVAVRRATSCLRGLPAASSPTRPVAPRR